MNFSRNAWFAAALAAVSLNATSASAAGSILAAATLSNAFNSSSTGNTPLPLNNDGITELAFTTTADNQTVVITYNAECDVAAARGTWLGAKIEVDNKQAAPKSGYDFALCSAVDGSGAAWLSVVRQSVIKVPLAGPHTLRVIASLRDGSGSWRIDDASLVVQANVVASATRTVFFMDDTTTPQHLQLKENGDVGMNFRTTVADEKVKVTYNAECNIATTQPGKVVMVLPSVPDATQVIGSKVLCHGVDTDGETWRAGTRQAVFTLPDPGNHSLDIIGSNNVGPAVWTVDDSSTVVQNGLLASGFNEDGVNGATTVVTPVPLRSGGGTTLSFKTRKNNQQVKITFNATCRIGGPRSRWVWVRVAVDGIEAEPATNSDFALCSAVADGFFWYHSGVRQSVITVPAKGTHELTVDAAPSTAESWGLSDIAVTVE